MFEFLTSRQPLFICTYMLSIGAAFLLPLFSFYQQRALAETQIAVGDKVRSLSTLAEIPNGQHQFCSEPESRIHLGMGTCFWFAKTGDQLIGYYGIPYSDVFIDCVSGTIQNETIVGEALTIAGEGAPFPKMENKTDSLTWQTISLSAGKLEYSSTSHRGALNLIKFNRAELSLRDFYRYSPAKTKLMQKPPSSCQVQYWIEQLAKL